MVKPYNIYNTNKKFLCYFLNIFVLYFKLMCYICIVILEQTITQ